MASNPLRRFGPDELLDWHIDRIRTVGKRSFVWVGDQEITYNHKTDSWDSFCGRIRVAVEGLYKELRKTTPEKKSSDPKTPYVNRPPRTARVVLAVA